MKFRKLIINYLMNLSEELETFFKSEEMDYYQLKFTTKLKEPTLLGFDLESYGTRTEERKTYEILDAVEGFSRLLILGEPGSGKTTALKWVTLHYAQGALDALKQNISPCDITIPVLAGLMDYQVLADTNSRLYHYQDKQYFASFLAMNLAKYLSGIKCDSETLLNELLTKYKVILLLDGFNEIFDQNVRRACAQAVHSFLGDHASQRCVISSRKYQFDANYFKRGKSFSFKPLEVEELGKREIREFLNVYKLTIKEADLFLNQADTKLRQLSQNPLLLSFLAKTFKKSRRLPRGKGTLFSEFVFTFVLDHPCQFMSEEQQKNYNLDRQFLKQIKHNICVDVASKMQLTGLDMTNKDIKEIANEHVREYDLNPTAVLQELRDNGILILQNIANVTIWRFKNQAYQEYFAACRIADKWLSHDYAAIDEYIQNAQWHEPLAMAVGIVEDYCRRNREPIANAVTLVNYIKGKGDVDSIILACKCVANMEDVDIREISDFTKLLHRSLRNCLPLLARFGHYLIGLVFVGWVFGFLLMVLVIPHLPSFKYFDYCFPAVVAYFFCIPGLALKAYNTRFEIIGRQLVERDILPILMALRYMSTTVPEARGILYDLLHERTEPIDVITPEEKLDAFIYEAVERSQWIPICDEEDLLIAIAAQNPDAVTMARYLVHQGISENVFTQLLEWLKTGMVTLREIVGNVVKVLCTRDERYRKQFDEFVRSQEDYDGDLIRYLSKLQKTIKSETKKWETPKKVSRLQQVAKLSGYIVKSSVGKWIIGIISAALTASLVKLLLKVIKDLLVIGI